MLQWARKLTSGMSGSADPRAQTVAFLQSKRFAVVGASADRAKFGNKVLRAYGDHGLDSTPVHPKLAEIEGIPVKQLAELEEPTQWGVSIVTPPSITLSVIEEGRKLGFTKYWLQPGAESKQVMEAVKEMDDIDVIAGGPCVLVSLQRGEHKLGANM